MITTAITRIITEAVGWYDGCSTSNSNSRTDVCTVSIGE